MHTDSALSQDQSAQRLRLGFIGGGLNSAVGYTHFVATRLDGLFEVVAGCFSTQAAINRETAKRYGVASDRCYASADKLLSAEVGKLDAVCILTPTPNHADMIVAALSRGFAVICEKALVTSEIEAEQVMSALMASNEQLFVTYTYAGYPMVREARALIESGSIGDVQQIYCEMPTEGFSRIDTCPQSWRRQDYALPCVSLDLGVHVHHLADYLLGGFHLKQFSAWQATFSRVPDVIDTVTVTGLCDRNILASLMWGKAALGLANGLNVRVFASNGSLQWTQTDPDRLIVCDNNGSRHVLERGDSSCSVASNERYNRFKAGHPTGFVEAFANIYSDFHTALTGRDAVLAEYFDADVATRGIKLLSQIHASATSC